MSVDDRGRLPAQPELCAESLTDPAEAGQRVPAEDKRGITSPPCLPNEVLLHVFAFLDAKALVAAIRVSRRWHELASDHRLWQRLCVERGFPKIDRRRYGRDWKQWYKRMSGRIEVNVYICDDYGKPLQNDYSPTTLLTESDNTVLGFVRAAGSLLNWPPHKIRLWRIDDITDNELGMVWLRHARQPIADAGIKAGSSVLCEAPDGQSGLYRRPYQL